MHSRSLHRAVSCVLALILVAAPVALPAAEAAKAASASSPAASKTVARGRFLRAAVGMLRLKLEKTVDIPYTGVPDALLPYVRTAQSYGALAVFDVRKDRIDWERAITRGEALQVLTALTKETPGHPLDRNFTDVQTEAAKKAAAVSLELRWLRPMRAKLFGWNRPLTLAEEKKLFKRVTETGGVIVLPPEQQTIRIDLNAPSPAIPKEEILETVWDLLSRDYLYKNKIKNNEAGYRSVEGLVQSLDDPYTVFYRPSGTKEFQNQIKGEITGIGAQVEQKEGILIIVAPLTGSPAEKAGLQAGDEILSVNGETLFGFSYEDAVNKVRGPKGSAANLRIRRNGAEMDVSVVRDIVRIADLGVTYEGDVAVVKLHQFGQIVQGEFRDKMKEVAGKQVRGIVLDLRNNPGGLLDAAGVVLSAFLPDGTPYVQIHTATERMDEKTSGAPVFDAAVKVVVVINRGSASASEIVAGALQDHRRAILVGETTFGKGTVQQLVEFVDGSSLKMTIAEWKTPNGRTIEGVGVEPDFSIPTEAARDMQMSRALELAR